MPHLQQDIFLPDNPGIMNNLHKNIFLSHNSCMNWNLQQNIFLLDTTNMNPHIGYPHIFLPSIACIRPGKITDNQRCKCRKQSNCSQSANLCFRDNSNMIPHLQQNIFLPHNSCTMSRFQENIFLPHNSYTLHRYSFDREHRCSIVLTSDSALCTVLTNIHMFHNRLLVDMQRP